MAKFLDNLYAFKMIRLLQQDWTKWGAYEEGIIDENGKRTDKKTSSPKEKKVWTFFHRATANIKRLLHKVPGGKSKIIRTLAVFALIKESNLSEEEQVVEYALYHTNLLVEASTAGDSGGSSDNIASGKNTGDIVGNIKNKKKKDNKIKDFDEFLLK